MNNQKLSNVSNWRSLAEQARFEPARLAKSLAVPPRTLERFFRARAGRAPGDWLRELRVRIAAQFLAAGAAVSAVVDSLGFCDRPQFHHQFRHVLQETPAEFLESWRRRELAYIKQDGSASLSSSPALELARAIEAMGAQLTGAHAMPPDAALESVRIALVDGDGGVGRKVQDAFVLLAPSWRLHSYSPSEQQLLGLLAEPMPAAVVVGCEKSRDKGRALVQRIMARLPQARVVTLREACDLDEALWACAAGVTGCVLKSASPHQLVQTLQAVLAGKTAFCAQAQAALLEMTKDIFDKMRRGASLTPRELEVAALRPFYDSKEIATYMHVALSTVHTFSNRSVGKTAS
jgi:DNA-binding NarL/FixJ family response regulator/AraC-like DNA-binding protein